MHDASILLTGATGYIGGRLLRSLEEGGHAVRCLARQPAKVTPTRLVERLPVMVCPRWVATLTQPIAIDDVLAYLVAALDLPDSGGRVFEIGGPEVVSYGDMMRVYWHAIYPVHALIYRGLLRRIAQRANADIGWQSPVSGQRFS